MPILRDWPDYLDCCRYTDKEIGDVITRLKTEPGRSSGGSYVVPAYSGRCPSFTAFSQRGALENAATNERNGAYGNRPANMR